MMHPAAKPYDHGVMKALANLSSNIKTACQGKDSTVSADQYYATDADAYVIGEPCIMCSMALVHSRVRRVFMIEATENIELSKRASYVTARDCRNYWTGGLTASRQNDACNGLQWVRCLNHHFLVYCVRLETGS
eukprot:Blabericola_migrator_1__8376@NODE_435_length_8501_cov_292_016244_g341_i0_p8_GENE_NODE_435_length_8501_cov_292_016244_g341_i0NODE_435_length_8501_cov_292_016244_g341_i0_p8_ORF_typecomplete_len134_score11_55dCMP_cyt_deam_1/PF00383_23/3e12MafB19deam/PF14437_6/7_6e10_NODE_435_length_8501_cov_292_016244_g341_i0553954